MKKIFITLWCLSFLCAGVFALEPYSPSASDTALLEKFEDRLDAMHAEDPDRVQWLKTHIANTLYKKDAPHTEKERKMFYLYKKLFDKAYALGAENELEETIAQANLSASEYNYAAALDVLESYPDKSDFRDIDWAALYSLYFSNQKSDFEENYPEIPENYEDEFFFPLIRFILTNGSADMDRKHIRETFVELDDDQKYSLFLRALKIKKQQAGISLFMLTDDPHMADIIEEAGQIKGPYGSRDLWVLLLQYWIIDIGEKQAKIFIKNFPSFQAYVMMSSIALMESCEESQDWIRKAYAMPINTDFHLYDAQSKIIDQIFDPWTCALSHDAHKRNKERYDQLKQEKAEFDAYLDTLDQVGKVAFRQWRNNQHTENGKRKTDPDGHGEWNAGEYGRWMEHASTEDRLIDYCKKFYPDTTDIRQIRNEEITARVDSASAISKSVKDAYRVKTYECLTK